MAENEGVFCTGARVSMLPISRPPFEPPWVPSVFAVPAPHTHTHTHTHRAAKGPNPIQDNKEIAVQKRFRNFSVHQNRPIIVHIVIAVSTICRITYRRRVR